MMGIFSMMLSTLATSTFFIWSFGPFCSAEPTSHNQAIQRSEEPANGTVYDYIIIGGGTSGLTVADRLTEDGSKSVLVIEYGYVDNGSDILIPPSSPAVSPSRVYNYTCLPQPELNNRTRRPTAAAVLGGGSAINGMYFDRGSADDYDSWEKLGNPGWGWEGLFPYFQKSVNFTPPSAELTSQFNITYDIAAYGSASRQVHSSFPPYIWPTQAVMMQAFRDYGLLGQREGANGGAVGVFWVPNAMDPDTRSRSYARTAHYDPIAHRKNYHLLTGYKVEKILFSEDLRAQTVQVVAREPSSATWTMIAKKEIIIATGAIHTPLLLQRSGLGSKELLKEAGIDVLVDLPGVGQNFQDHAICSNIYNFTNDLVPNRAMMASDLAFNAAAQKEYQENKTGPVSGGAGSGGAFIPLRNLTSSYIFIINSTLSQNASSYIPAQYTGALLQGFLKQREIMMESWASNNSAVIEIPISGGATSTMVILKPLSRGSITINPSDPFGNPLVDYNTLVNPIDRQLLIEGLKLSREIFNSKALLELGAVEITPGANVTSDADVRAWIRDKADSSIAHPCGTASMMPRKLGGVVGPDLLVYGVKGLSIVDASIMPLIPGTHLSATVYAVAEKVS
ncbi:choline dehydrogenase-like protein [Rhexocercosporidium sp. MPI-PUGE-AT-0058]|nr:choline dehydrogenase-like protein [Rhexocercosporidium sp. MPI-PUGE-AT-0058]